METYTSVFLTELNSSSTGVPEITPAGLYGLLQNPSNVFLLDVRNEEEFNTWKVEGRFNPEMLHIFYGEFIEDEENSARRVPANRPVVVICAKGGASYYVAEVLRSQYNIPAVNLSEGMVGWGNYYHVLPVVEEANYQIYQINRAARGCLSYLIVSQDEAIIIDPLRHLDPYRELLQSTGTRLALILDTHGHADHISGGVELSNETGAPYYLHPYDGIHPFDMLPATLPYQMLADGQRFEIGKLVLETVHVPGHTLGQVNFLLQAPDHTSCLFSGDNLFLKSFGRPDLGGRGNAWAPLVYKSIFEIIKKRVPGDALVLPGHFATHEEANDSGVFACSLSELWEKNADLQVGDRETFIDHVLNHLPEMPPQYVQIKRVNAGLAKPDEEEASVLELGKNVCALSTAY